MGGGAFAYGRHRARVEEEHQQEAYDAGQQEAMTASAAPPPPAGGLTQEDTQRLAELGKLHEQGILTDAEFSAEKAKILGL